MLYKLFNGCCELSLRITQNIEMELLTHPPFSVIFWLTTVSLMLSFRFFIAKVYFHCPRF